MDDDEGCQGRVLRIGTGTILAQSLSAPGPSTSPNSNFPASALSAQRPGNADHPEFFTSDMRQHTDSSKVASPILKGIPAMSQRS